MKMQMKLWVRRKGGERERGCGVREEEQGTEELQGNVRGWGAIGGCI
jgi:hypothetical protein